MCSSWVAGTAPVRRQCSSWVSRFCFARAGASSGDERKARLTLAPSSSAAVAASPAVFSSPLLSLSSFFLASSGAVAPAAVEAAPGASFLLNGLEFLMLGNLERRGNTANSDLAEVGGSCWRFKRRETKLSSPCGGRGGKEIG